MSRANAYLLNSLMWNLQEMTSLIKLITEKVGNANCSSWRHPLLSCGELDVLQLLEDNKDSDRYTYLLELTFDRLIHILNLIVKYMESFDSLSEFKPGKSVERPRNLSMASILCMMWDRIEAHFERAVGGPKTVNSKPSTCSSFTQSDITSLTACSTCELAQNLVTQIVLKMENYFGGDSSSSALLTQRKLMKEKLVSTSNWSAMMAWVNAVLEDLSSMCEETQKFKDDNRRLRSRIDSGDRNLIARTKKQDEEVKIMLRTCRESDEKVRALGKEVGELREEKRRQEGEIAGLREKNTELSKRLIEAEAKRKSIEEKLEKREKMDNDWKAKLEREIRKREAAENSMETLKCSLTELEAMLASAKSRCSVLQTKSAFAMEKINRLQEENGRLLSTINEKQKEIDKFSAKLLDAFPDLCEDDKNNYRGTGDPLKDMKHQIEANKLRISKLTVQNENLSQTINRIEAVRDPPNVLKM